MFPNTLKCARCGRFHRGGYGTAWKMVYSGVIPEPDHEITSCAECVALWGPFTPDPRIKPECSCGVIRTLPQRALMSRSEP